MIEVTLIVFLLFGKSAAASLWLPLVIFQVLEKMAVFLLAVDLVCSFILASNVVSYGDYFLLLQKSLRSIPLLHDGSFAIIRALGSTYDTVIRLISSSWMPLLLYLVITHLQPNVVRRRMESRVAYLVVLLAICWKVLPVQADVNVLGIFLLLTVLYELFRGRDNLSSLQHGQQLKQLFQVMDKDGDRKLSLNEFEYGYRMFISSFTPRSIIVEQFVSADENGDGKISYDEFEQYALRGFVK